MKDKGNMYKNRIDKNVNNSQRVYSTLNNDNIVIKKVNDNKKTNDFRSIDRKIYDIMHSNDYIYKADVVIVMKDKTINKKIVGKNGNNLITIDNEYINISDIIDIYKEKRN